jgi:S-adenosylmethionine:tRNA ribosyltransferase-isomerase
MPFAEARATGGRYDFVLPPELEAHEPPELRGASRADVRLLVTDTIHGVRHSHFDSLPDHLESGDLLVANDSMTYPACVQATRETGELVTLYFSNIGPEESANNASTATTTVLAAARKASLSTGERVSLPGGARATFFGLHRRSRRMWITELSLPIPYYAYFARYGEPIAYPHVTVDLPIETYQTIFARTIGSSEMPSAGRPFSAATLSRLASRGIEVATLTLHAGVSSAERDELPLEEWRDVPAKTAAAVRLAQNRGRRVVAVGTTVVRALESSLDRRHRVVPTRGWTSLRITPDRPMRAVGGLLTGFHEPTSTHLAILESIGGRAPIECAYRAALAGRYLWHEFGDSHLILP